MNDIRLNISAKINGIDAPGFEGGLELRRSVERIEPFNTVQIPNDGTPAALPASSIDVGEVIALTLAAPCKLYFQRHDELAGPPGACVEMGAGSVLILAGVRLASTPALAGVLKIENEGTTNAPVEGFVGGSSQS